MNKKPRELHPLHQRTTIESWFKDAFEGYAPKLVGSKAITGKFDSPTKAKVTIRIKQLLANVSIAKIGVMVDLDSRMDRSDYRRQFNLVQRVYKTTSKEFAKSMEVYMIKKFKISHPTIILNISETPASRLITYNGYYYVYVVYNDIHI